MKATTNTKSLCGPIQPDKTIGLYIGQPDRTPSDHRVFYWVVMLDGLQIENKTLFDLVQLQERRIVVLKAKVKQLQNEIDILISDSLEKDEDPSSEFCEK